MEQQNKQKNMTFAALRYVIPLVWKKRKPYIICSALYVFFNAVNPFVDLYFLPRVIDSLIAGKPTEVVLRYAACMIGLNVLTSLLASLFQVHSEKDEDYFLNLHSEEVAMRCMEIDYALTENKEALDQAQKARDGINYSGGAHGVMRAFFLILANGIRIFGVVALLIVNAPWLLLIIGVILALSAWINHRRNLVDIQQFGELSKINRVFGYLCWEIEDFRYGKDVRLYGAAGTMLEKASQQIARLTAYWDDINERKYPLSVLDLILSAIRDFGTYLYLGALAIFGKITIGVFSQLITAGGTLNAALQGVIFGVQDIVKRSNYLYEIVRFMEYPAYIEKGDRRVQNLDKPHTIEFRNVSFHYPNTEVSVLKDVSITLRPGERLSVVGLNGAGKTTFIKLLCRLYDVDEGAILLDGVDIRAYDYAEYMKLFSVVFQDFQLLSFTAEDNILLGDEDKDDRLSALFEEVGLKKKIDSLPHGRKTLMFKQFDREGVELSGGEQQKMAIARALYKDAPVIILDEPTAALDPVAEYEIYRQFDALVGGKTAVYISHRLSSCKFCDRIAVFSEGTIKELGTHEALVNKPDGIYAEMFRAQAQYYISDTE